MPCPARAGNIVLSQAGTRGAGLDDGPRNASGGRFELNLKEPQWYRSFSPEAWW